MGGERKKPEGCCLPSPVLGRGGKGNVALGCVCPALSIVGDVVASSLPLPSAGACSGRRTSSSIRSASSSYLWASERERIEEDIYVWEGVENTREREKGRGEIMTSLADLHHRSPRVEGGGIGSGASKVSSPSL